MLKSTNSSSSPLQFWERAIPKADRSMIFIIRHRYLKSCYSIIYPHADGGTPFGYQAPVVLFTRYFPAHRVGKVGPMVNLQRTMENL
jgi:hypothetical protein